jgi:hypothetical protein
MGLAPELKLVIKHTFLEYVGDEKASPAHKRTRPRAVTDPSSCDDLCYGEVRKHFHDDSADLDSSSSSSGSTVSLEPHVLQASSANSVLFQLGSLVTPEGTPLQCPSDPFSTWWQDEEWSMGALPEAVDQHYVWTGHGGDGHWWGTMAYETGVITSSDCNHHLDTIYEQYHANCLEQAYTRGDSAEVVQAKPSVLKELDSSGAGKETRTTVMIRELPECITRTSLLRLLGAEGFFGRFDFLYLPVDFKRQQNLGYALVNLVSPSEALRFCKHFDGFSQWDVPTDKICNVGWCSPQQGLEAHVERYRNSPVMHESVPEEWRPLLLSHGVAVSFPAPTQKIKAPKVKGMNL